MKTNPTPIHVIPKIPKNCKGFVDSLGRELKPGDEIIVKAYSMVVHAVITRFTPKRIYWKVLYADDSMPAYWFDYDNYTQLHSWYGDGYAGHSNPAYHTQPEDTRRLRNVMKLEDPAPTPEPEDDDWKLEVEEEARWEAKVS